MVIGQGAGVAAALAAKDNVAVQELKYVKLRERLLAQKQILDLPDVSDLPSEGDAIAAKTLPGIVLDETDAELIGEWQNGYDVVYAQRTHRRGESLLKRTTAHFFYRIIQRVNKVTIPEDTGDFRILSRRAVNALNSFGEQHRFMKGLFAWLGFRSIDIRYQRPLRAHGKSKWNYWKFFIRFGLVKLFNGIF